MAEQILFNIIADVLTKLGFSSIQRIGSAFGVAKEFKKLMKKLEIIRGVILDAEEKQENNHAVRAWVRRLKDVVYDADDLLDDLQTLQLQRGGVARQVSNFFSTSNQLVFRFKMSNRFKKIKEEIDEIVKEIPLLNLIEGNMINREVQSSWRETHSFVLTSELVERDEDKEEIIKLLVSSENEKILSAVAVIGMGGLGKTTLAQLVYNDNRVVEFFEPKIWVCVSDDFDVKFLVRKILESLTGGVVGNLESLEVLKGFLHEKLSRKRYFVILDDVWNDDFRKWDQLKTLLMVGATGSKILLTTRNRNVASVMGIDHFPFYLKGLKESQCWNLFSKIAFEQGQERMYPDLVEIGKEIVTMCKGVPLVIKTLGAILRCKTNELAWLSIKNNENLVLLDSGNSDRILAVLKLSYDDLPSHLKQCFTYCTLFPKDFEIEKKLLVKLWLAQGYIQTSNAGNQYFEELLSRSLLEEAERDADNNILCCKMHDLIHDLAQSIVGSEVLILGDNVKQIVDRVYHVSFSHFYHMHSPKDLRIEQLRTIFKYKRLFEGDSNNRKLVPKFKSSRVLSLCAVSLNKIPESISRFTHLRYLDLSYHKFGLLPDTITRLYNLQTLELTSCGYLKEFPKNMRELINLRYLENDGCTRLRHMPCGIGELTLLESLPLFVLGTGSKVGRLSELKRLNNLRGELRIQQLENMKGKAESEEANLGEKQYIEVLKLEWSGGHGAAGSGEEDESLIVGLRPHRNLKVLSVEGYGGGRLPSWMMNGGLSSMLPNLSRIVLSRCSGCRILPSFVELPHLKFLELSDLEKVEHMECSSEGPFFPSLETLSLSKMPKLKEIWRRRDDLLPTHPNPPFPRLSKIEIKDCADLASVLLPPCPVVSKLLIRDCGTLASFSVPPAALLSYLEISFCDDLASLELHSSPDRKLLIRECPMLTSLSVPPSPLLSYVEIRSCGALASLELHSSPYSKLLIGECPKLTSLSVPPSLLLSYVEIRSCGALASLELHSSPDRKVLIRECPKLTCLSVPPSPLLSYVEIRSCGNLASLELQSSPSLSKLEICGCPKLTSLQVSSLPCLKILVLDEVGEEVLHRLMLSTTASSLELMSISSIYDLVTLPDELHQHVSTLQSLQIKDCSRLAKLPRWIGNLTSLRTLGIRNCPELASLSQDMRFLSNLTSLNYLRIASCPQLTSFPEEFRCLTKLPQPSRLS